MRFDVITLFPELFERFLQAGVTRRAFEGGQVQVRLWNLRDFAQGNYRRVDDRPFGGGPGMVMMAPPLLACLQAIRADRAAADVSVDTSAGTAGPAVQAGAAVPEGSAATSATVPVVLFSPIGRTLDQAEVGRWSAGKGAILVCGRYEGLDQRFIDAHVDVQISLGDFVLSGGEIPAMALLDAVARLQPGVLGDADSHAQDSFNPALDGLLDCPHYTRPEVWEGQGVPPELLSGHHAQIERWRRDRRLDTTARHRPDLIEQARRNGLLDASDERTLATLAKLL